ncbi:MAG: hypothetical protein H7Z38_21485, partial [Rubrivivax sp.]|nr:hypothetical protein [Pyrinomonadaceae bacterium]
MSQTEKEVTTGSLALAPDGDEHALPEVRAALSLARRYRLPYVDLLPPSGESP